MRTTLDIPDEVFKKAKLKAVHDGVTFKDIVTQALTREIASPATDPTLRQARAAKLFAALDQARNTQPIGRLNRDAIHDRAGLR